MYRQVIEHPEWIPAEAQRKLNLQGGSDRGRIYRIVPTGECCQEGTPDADQQPSDEPEEGDTVKTSPAPIPELRAWFGDSNSNISSDELILRLASPNGWWRDTAQRLLIHRGQDATTIDKLRKMLKQHKSPLARLHALCTACELAPENTELIRIGLNDAHPGVQRHALRLSETALKAANALIVEEVMKLSTSKDRHVLLQLAHLFSVLPESDSAALLPGFLSSVQHFDDIASVALHAVTPSNAIAVLDGLEALDAGDADFLLSRELRNSMGLLIGQRLNAEQLTRFFNARLTSEVLADATIQDLSLIHI